LITGLSVLSVFGIGISSVFFLFFYQKQSYMLLRKLLTRTFIITLIVSSEVADIASNLVTCINISLDAENVGIEWLPVFILITVVGVVISIISFTLETNCIGD
jgi:hypothetical protein